MTQDVSTPDEHNPAEVPQAPTEGTHILDQVPETQTITTSDIGSLSAMFVTQIETPAPPPAEMPADEGLALLKSSAQAVESEVRKVVTFIEHSIVAAGVGPRTVEAARNLPFAAPGETLFEAGEHLLFRAFLDVGDEVRHIYLNEFGNHVKA